ncbi:MAG: hypothetical protein HYS09_05415 [Chloroflexi bacterium]|nr:hypothetical protein [Chloroflexota bacterium]
MEVSNRETWAALHGMFFGAIFLIAFAGGLAGLWSLRPEWVTVNGIRERMFRLKVGVSVMAAVAWVTVVTGTWIVYPWYRAAPPEDATDLSKYPRSLLLETPGKEQWHTFGMEWKEHVAWMSPILATAVAFIVLYYGNQLIVDKKLRYASIVLYILAFAAAGVAGALGAFITKAAPIL